MRKSVTVQLPREKPVKVISSQDKIYEFCKKPRMLKDIEKYMKMNRRNIQSYLQRLKSEDKMQTVLCKCCNVGTFFKSL